MKVIIVIVLMAILQVCDSASILASDLTLDCPAGQVCYPKCCPLHTVFDLEINECVILPPIPVKLFHMSIDKTTFLPSLKFKPKPSNPSITFYWKSFGLSVKRKLNISLLAKTKSDCLQTTRFTSTTRGGSTSLNKLFVLTPLSIGLRT